MMQSIKLVNYLLRLNAEIRLTKCKLTVNVVIETSNIFDIYCLAYKALILIIHLEIICTWTDLLNFKCTMFVCEKLSRHNISTVYSVTYNILNTVN